MFILSRKNIRKDGSTPFLLSGYGGFNEPAIPYFEPEIAAWLETGGAYALPNLRGGGEYGETWHKAGMLTKKRNTFDDFISAANFLIQKGYTRPDLLAIDGNSNGGLLVGAALTQRPDLFRAVICQVPLLDMIRYPLFGQGKTWIPEYGSPDNEEQFRALFTYSPYHHVTSGVAYPSILFFSNDNDDRVGPMHARKMTAALQAADPHGNPILLRTEFHAGHGGSDLTKLKAEEAADKITFLINELGLASTKTSPAN
jgi:prolyl oligopeptidase